MAGLEEVKGDQGPRGFRRDNGNPHNTGLLPISQVIFALSRTIIQSHQPRRSCNMSNQIDHAQAVVKLIRNVNEDTSFQYVCGVLDENSVLKAEIGKVRAANEFSDEKIIRLKTDLDTAHAESAEKDEKLTARAREKDVLTVEVNKKKKELAENSKQLSSLQSELKQKETKIADLKTAFHDEQQKAKDRDALAEQVDSITDEIRDRDRQLQWLESMSFKLTPLPHQDMYDSLISYPTTLRLGEY